MAVSSAVDMPMEPDRTRPLLPRRDCLASSFCRLSFSVLGSSRGNMAIKTDVASIKVPRQVQPVNMHGTIHFNESVKY
jgi:hypothetical protein